MAYVVLDNCIKCKYTDCVEVCPVDCFYEGENMLVIHPDECIDCGVCEPECPAAAIKPDTAKKLGIFPQLNADMAKIWPNLAIKRKALPEAKEFNGKKNYVKWHEGRQERWRREEIRDVFRRGECRADHGGREQAACSGTTSDVHVSLSFG